MASVVLAKCIVCMDKLVTHAFAHCGHVCLCYECAVSYPKDNYQNSYMCVYCRVHSKKIIKLYFPSYDENYDKLEMLKLLSKEEIEEHSKYCEKLNDNLSKNIAKYKKDEIELKTELDKLCVDIKKMTELKDKLSQKNKLLSTEMDKLSQKHNLLSTERNNIIYTHHANTMEVKRLNNENNKLIHQIKMLNRKKNLINTVYVKKANRLEQPNNSHKTVSVK